MTLAWIDNASVKFPLNNCATQGLMRRVFSQAAMRATLLLALVLAAPWASAQQGYKVGQIVATNLSLVNRYAWTNDTGQVFTPSNTALRLSDFDGKIVFFELFAVW